MWCRFARANQMPQESDAVIRAEGASSEGARIQGQPDCAVNVCERLHGIFPEGWKRGSRPHVSRKLF